MRFYSYYVVFHVLLLYLAVCFINPVTVEIVPYYDSLFLNKNIILFLNKKYHCTLYANIRHSLHA